MNQISSVVLVAALAMALMAGGARAQFFYSSPPPLMGQRSFHLYSVPGLMNNVYMETFFACTNTTSANIRVGVEVFGPPGGGAANDPSATSLDVTPGATVILGTDAAVGILVSGTLGVPPMSKGSARILATKPSGIICSAFLADPGNAPPTSIAELKVVKNKTQKGD